MHEVWQDLEEAPGPEKSLWVRQPHLSWESSEEALQKAQGHSRETFPANRRMQRLPVPLCPLPGAQCPSHGPLSCPAQSSLGEGVLCSSSCALPSPLLDQLFHQDVNRLQATGSLTAPAQMTLKPHWGARTCPALVRGLPTTIGKCNAPWGASKVEHSADPPPKGTTGQQSCRAHAGANTHSITLLPSHTEHTYSEHHLTLSTRGHTEHTWNASSHACRTPSSHPQL